MFIDSNMVISGFVSKVVNDCVDVLKSKIKDADKNRKANEQNIETRIYQVMIDVLNEFPYNEYKKEEKVYDATESMLKGFKGGKEYNEAIRVGLKIIVLQVTDDICKIFLGTLRHEICKDENDVLYKEIEMLWQEQANGNLKEIAQNQEEELGMLGDVKKDTKYIREILEGKEANGTGHYNEIHIENRAKEYADKWDKNVFLNNFNKRDKKAGENIKLRDLYLDEHLPHYIWRANDTGDTDIEVLLREYIVDNDDKKMLLILGQAGIGKSTLITWIMANLVKNMDQIYVYQFASDLKNVDWQRDDILKDILKKLSLGYDELENKVLILDGFDEIHTSGDSERILNQVYHELKEMNYLKQFSLIITCRENYIYELQKVECDYITLLTWNDEQIKSFCEIYENMGKNKISQNTFDKVLDNKEVFGIPLILYMVLSLNISIGESASIMDVYDQIFTLKGGGIYDRCITNLSYASPHRISIIKQQIHQISQRIAFWIFENKSERAFIDKDNYEKICNEVINETSVENEDIKRDVLIGNYFETIKHCEGIGTDELYFVHRSIYEYFVVIYFFESLCNITSIKELAGKIGQLLKCGILSEQILEFIKYKFDSMKGLNQPDIIKEIFRVMLQDGMTYHIKDQYKNFIEQEMNIFSNILDVGSLWNMDLKELDDRIIIYLQCNRKQNLKLKSINLRDKRYGIDLSRIYLKGADLRGAYLRGVNLSRVDLSEAYLKEADLEGTYLREADLKEAYLEGACLRGANLERSDLKGTYLRKTDLRGAVLRGADLENAVLVEADLRGADLILVHLNRVNLKEAVLVEANLIGADLREADLRGADLRGANLFNADLVEANLRGTIFDERLVELLQGEYNLGDSSVYIFETEEIISYEEYCNRK